jgi:hypothetical protein
MTPIPDWPNYFIDEEANVYSTMPKGSTGGRYARPPKVPRKLKQHIGGQHYHTVSLTKDRVSYEVKVAVLMLQTFASPRPQGMLACHGVSGRRIDTIDNLYWGTPKQNCDDRIRDGTAARGQTHGKAKLNEIQVRVIRRANEFGVSQRVLMKMFGLTSGPMSHIICRNTWKHI